MPASPKAEPIGRATRVYWLASLCISGRNPHKSIATGPPSSIRGPIRAGVDLVVQVPAVVTVFDPSPDLTGVGTAGIDSAYLGPQELVDSTDGGHDHAVRAQGSPEQRPLLGREDAVVSDAGPRARVLQAPGGRRAWAGAGPGGRGHALARGASHVRCRDGAHRRTGHVEAQPVQDAHVLARRVHRALPVDAFAALTPPGPVTTRCASRRGNAFAAFAPRPPARGRRSGAPRSNHHPLAGQGHELNQGRRAPAHAMSVSYAMK